jgi:hypothetical protein
VPFWSLSWASLIFVIAVPESMRRSGHEYVSVQHLF